MIRKSIIGLFMLASTYVHAGLIQFTANSASDGELGWIVVDEDVLSGDKSLLPSQFYDYSFSDPLSDLSLNPANILADTGTTYFAFVNNTWTISNGGGRLKTADGLSIWIGGVNQLELRKDDVSYTDISWITTEYVVAMVSEPRSVFLLSFGTLMLLLKRRKTV